MNTSILYYTNNVLSKPLLKETLFAAAKHAQDNDAELLISSHYPLTHSHLTETLGDHDFCSKDGIYSKVVVDSWHLPCDHYREFVVGKMPYVLCSIAKQILHLLEYAQGENIVLMEHDCFYPEDYVQAVTRGLIEHPIGYILKSHVCLNYDGFWKMCSGVSFMSCFSFRKRKAIEVLKKKIELGEKNNLSYFEPILSCYPDYLLKRYPQDEVYDSHICIDDFLLESHEVLDIKHGVNQGGYLMANSGKMDKNHAYWGESSKYLSFLKAMNLSRLEMNRYGYGISMY